MECTMTIVTLTELAGAIEHRLKLPRDEAQAHAENVLDFFGMHNEVLDNLLENEERQVFYALQLEGLLTTRSDETELWNGQRWRSLSWALRIDRIQEAAHVAEAARDHQPTEIERSAHVYADLPEDAWNRRVVST